MNTRRRDLVATLSVEEDEDGHFFLRASITDVRRVLALGPWSTLDGIMGNAARQIHEERSACALARGQRR